MRHYVCFPAADAKRGAACAKAWQEKGYIPLVMTDADKWTVEHKTLPGFTLLPAYSPFPGYYRVINEICRQAVDEGADLITCIGDDMSPPTQGAAHHSKLFMDHFGKKAGVMQCTGDRQGTPQNGLVPSERICGSPTFNPDWVYRAFNGTGPFGQYGFKSYYCDEMLHDVSERVGLLYQEPDLCIDHLHWSFGRSSMRWWHEAAQRNWDHDKALFDKLKAEGFPGSELME